MQLHCRMIRIDHMCRSKGVSCTSRLILLNQWITIICHGSAALCPFRMSPDIAFALCC